MLAYKYRSYSISNALINAKRVPIVLSFQVIRIFTQLPQGILMKILRGAPAEVITAELAKIHNTKSYDNRAEARYDVLLCKLLNTLSLQ